MTSRNPANPDRATEWVRFFPTDRTQLGSYGSRQAERASTGFWNWVRLGSVPIQNRDITSEAFCPPKPKLLEMAVRTGISRAVLGT